MFKETEQGETQYCPMCLEWSEKYKRLQAENEELNEKIKKHKANNLELLKYADEDKSDIDRLEQLYQDEHCDNLQLRKALEEIREYLQQFKKKKSNFYTINDVLTDIAQKIENKINEVLKDER